MPQPVILSTRNAHKVREVREILGGEFEVLDLSAVADAPIVKETGETFEANALLKAVAISKQTSLLVLADDSGLEVDALGGAPGVYSARFAGSDVDDAANRRLLIERLQGIRGKARSARFRCVIAAAKSGTALGTFSGAVEGVIINQEKGVGGFGYDSLFVPDGFCNTFAELPSETKNSLSHRARALDAFRRWVEEAS